MSRPPANGSPLTLVHFSDLHLWRFGLDGDLFPKRFLGLGNLVLKRARRFPRHVALRVIEKLCEIEGDYLCFSGDLSTTALFSEFKLGQALFAPLRERWGKRFLAIPGNHDRYTPRAMRKKHFEAFFYPAFDAAPKRWQLHPGWQCIGLDLSCPRWLSACGQLPEAQFQALETMLQEIKAQDQRCIVMGHYPLLYPRDVRADPMHAMASEARARLCALLDRYGVVLYLHGHKHQRWRLESNRLTHLNAGSAGMTGPEPDRAPGFLTITLSGDMLSPEIRSHWLRNASDPDGAEWTETPLESSTFSAQS